MLEINKSEFSPWTFSKQINRHHSTVYRELKRNMTSEPYRATSVSQISLARRRRGHRKVNLESVLWKFIVEAIRCLSFPEQISKRIKQFHDLDSTMLVSHTTIYSTIRALPKGELKKDLVSCLRHEKALLHKHLNY